MEETIVPLKKSSCTLKFMLIVLLKMHSLSLIEPGSLVAHNEERILS